MALCSYGRVQLRKEVGWRDAGIHVMAYEVMACDVMPRMAMAHIVVALYR